MDVGFQPDASTSHGMDPPDNQSPIKSESPNKDQVGMETTNDKDSNCTNNEESDDLRNGDLLAICDPKANGDDDDKTHKERDLKSGTSAPEVKIQMDIDLQLDASTSHGMDRPDNGSPNIDQADVETTNDRFSNCGNNQGSDDELLAICDQKADGDDERDLKSRTSTLEVNVQMDIDPQSDASTSHGTDHPDNESQHKDQAERETTNVTVDQAKVETTNVTVDQAAVETTNVIVDQAEVEKTNVTVDQAKVETTNVTVDQAAVETTNVTVDQAEVEKTNVTVDQAKVETTNVIVDQAAVETTNVTVDQAKVETTNVTGFNCRNNVLSNDLRYDELLTICNQTASGHDDGKTQKKNDLKTEPSKQKSKACPCVLCFVPGKDEEKKLSENASSSPSNPDKVPCPTRKRGRRGKDKEKQQTGLADNVLSNPSNQDKIPCPTRKRVKSRKSKKKEQPGISAKASSVPINPDQDGKCNSDIKVPCPSRKRRRPRKGQEKQQTGLADDASSGPSYQDEEGTSQPDKKVSCSSRKRARSGKGKDKQSSGLAVNASSSPGNQEQSMDVSDTVNPISCGDGLANKVESKSEGEKQVIPQRSQMICEACNKPVLTKVGQCCVGHELCNTCIEIASETELSYMKKGFVTCPQPHCHSSVPQSELRKVLPSVMLDSLEDFWKKQALEAIHSMNDLFKCPGCAFPTALDANVKKFTCMNCNNAYCRYCQKKWGKVKVHSKCRRKQNTWTSLFTEKDTVESSTARPVCYGYGTAANMEVNHYRMDNETPVFSPPSTAVCEACSKDESSKMVYQCSEGHKLCTLCVETSSKRELSEHKRGFVTCPKPDCTGSMPAGELRKALPSMVLDMLEDSWKKQAEEAVEKMSDHVRCPGCGLHAVLDVDVKKFKCALCMTTFCRYCKEEWVMRSNHYLCTQTKKWTSTITGNIVNIPENWTYSDTNSEGQIVKEVDPSTMEFEDIFGYFTRHIQVESIKLYRIQNERLWEKYSLTKSHIASDLGVSNINEKRLFHGTSNDVIAAICKEGFDLRLCGKNGVWFGQGIYFSNDAQYSHGYSSSKAVNSDRDNVFAGIGPENVHAKSTDCFMFLARVLLGRSCLGSKDMRRPEKDRDGHETYSAVNIYKNPSVFVVFDNTQCYPDYLIQY